jgi:hypothetical protein
MNDELTPKLRNLNVSGTSRRALKVLSKLWFVGVI